MKYGTNYWKKRNLILGGKSSFLTHLSDLEQTGHRPPLWLPNEESITILDIESSEQLTSLAWFWVNILLAVLQRDRESGRGKDTQKGHAYGGLAFQPLSLLELTVVSREPHRSLLRVVALMASSPHIRHRPSVSPMRTKLLTHEHKEDKPHPSHNRLR